MDRKATKLTPPDQKRCQAEKPNGVTFMTYGGRFEMVRCTNAPRWIATEIEIGKDGKRGGMSLCADCRAVLEMQMPRYATFRPIRRQA